MRFVDMIRNIIIFFLTEPSKYVQDGTMKILFFIAVSFACSSTLSLNDNRKSKQKTSIKWFDFNKRGCFL